MLTRFGIIFLILGLTASVSFSHPALAEGGDVVVGEESDQPFEGVPIVDCDDVNDDNVCDSSSTTTSGD